MNKIPQNYIEKVYAGWLGKIIGIRHGSNIEGWSYEKIEKVYGEVKGYLFDFKNFAADDDSNGPIFFVRALEDYTHTSDITAEQIGLTWLNYAPYEHGFYWWGGYGKSTEHTGYLNLRNGIMAPRSGSVEQNGAAVAEQIGGQIFIDCWGLVVPGNPSLAAEYASKAASVAHGGNGVYGGMFIAACISAAFIEQDIEQIIELGLSQIPSDCEYVRMSKAVIEFYKAHPGNWRACFKFVKDNFGYDKYPGACHIIPNSAVIILSLLYSEGDFSRALNICNMCGWDTDCNVANVGTIMGVRNGIEAIDYNTWRKPINDFLACSSVVGSLNILDIPWCAYYFAKLGYKIAGEEVPTEWVDILSGAAPKFNFELPGSTHSFRMSSDVEGNPEYFIENTEEFSYTGKHSLKVSARPLGSGNEVRLFHKTYYRPEDFNDSRYDPSFSPILYPGQTIKSTLMLAKESELQGKACLYVKNGNTGEFIESEKVTLIKGEWQKLTFDIPCLDGVCIEEVGVKFIAGCVENWNATLLVYMDKFDFRGRPDYSIDFSKERMDVWQGLHQEVSQFTYLNGIWLLENGELSGSCSNYAEAYTGGYDWTDYSFEATLKPKMGEYHNINFRVQGAIRSYGVGLAPNNKIVLYKNANGYNVLAEKSYEWEPGKAYRIKVEVYGQKITVYTGGSFSLEYFDEDKPYLYGQIGASVQKGSHCHYKDFKIKPIE